MRILTVACLCIARSLLAAPPGLAAPHAADHVLVKFRKKPSEEVLARAKGPPLQALLSQLPMAAGARLEAPRLQHMLRHRGGPLSEELPPNLDRYFYLKLPPGLSVEQCLARLQNHPLLEYAEPDGIGQGGFTPNDPDFFRQWHHHNDDFPSADINTPSAWNITQGSSNVVVAVLDSGLSLSLAEFSGRVVPGYDFANDDDDPTDDHGHGTAVSGTLLAAGNNGLTVAGVDWNCRVMPVKVLSANNTGLYSWWADAMEFAVAQGADIINLSAGGGGSSSTLTSAINNAISNGVIFVTITHNNGSSTITYPGNLPQCITVGATNEQDERAGFSNYGPQIDLVAPGTNIWTLSTSGSRSRWWGTSFSAPLVSGVCALLRACDPNLDQEDAFRLLALGSDDQVGGPTDLPGHDDEYGWGRLNAYNSLVLLKTSIDRISYTTNNAVVLSWPSPPNAEDKQPFHVQFATSAEGPWTTFSDPSHYQYESGETTWTDDGSLTGSAHGKFFRLYLRAL